METEVDATYRTDLREINELNFARFDAKLEQRIAELRAELVQRLAEFGTALERRLEERLEMFAARFDKRIDRLTRLMILAWVTVIAAVIGTGLMRG